LVSAALLVGAAYSAPGAGHGGGGGHGGGRGHAVGGFGGFHGGAFHPGGFHGRGFYGWHGGYYPGFWGYPWWYGFGLGFGLGCGYPYPYYPYGLPLYGDPGYYGPAICVSPPPLAGSAPVVAAPVPVAAGDVLFDIRVPDNATVSINGAKTTQGGPNREFLSSGLVPGRTYTFDIQARWPAPDGTVVQLERRVSVQGGQRRTVDFLRPAQPEHTVVPASSACGS
jgi:uncharacterized protein (TIGR03000 family)